MDTPVPPFREVLERDNDGCSRIAEICPKNQEGHEGMVPMCPKPLDLAAYCG